MKYKLLSLALPLALASVQVSAQTITAPAPDATFLMGSDMFAGGQSNNMGPVMNQILDLHWVKGGCPLSTDPNDFSKCDDLRFGLTMFADKKCNDNAPTVGVSALVTASEDGGDAVANRVKTIQNEDGVSWCDEQEFRPHDVGIKAHRKLTLPKGTTATDVELDQYWERPRLTLFFVGAMPQTSNTKPGNRVIDTLRETCISYDGAGGLLPSMPTWTFATRKYGDDAVPYAGLVAAAGGTGACCYGSGCDPVDDAIDVCKHIDDGRTDTQIRKDIADGEYNCGPTGEAHATGALNFGDPPSGKGTKPAIMCHLVGEEASNNCDKYESTDLLGIFSCVRQLPRGISADDANFVFCASSDPDSCKPLDEVGGTIEWIDKNKTLFLVQGVSCEAGSIGVSTCEPNVPCIVDGATGRCALGATDCSTGTEVCVSELGPMPEICNGLDDDCDGGVDNIVKSWNDPQFAGMSLPSQYAGLDCNVQDVCVCANGDTDFHAGPTFASYLAEWDPVCECGEGLAPSEEPPPTQSESSADPQAACSAVTDREGAVGASFLAMLLGGVVAWRHRR